MQGKRASTAGHLRETMQASEADWRAHDEPPRLLLTVNDALKVIGMTRTTFYREMQRGRIDTLMNGGRRMVPYFALTAYVRRLCDEQGIDMPLAS